MAAAKILIVEDDLFLRDIYHHTLIEAGFDVYDAVDGEEGLNKILQGGWDIVLLDFMMPRKNGLEVIQELKKTGSTSLAKQIVFLTNIDDTKEINEITRLSDGYLLKTQLTPMVLVEKVKGFLATQQQLAAL